jgi:hypothetical protein
LKAKNLHKSRRDVRQNGTHLHEQTVQSSLVVPYPDAATIDASFPFPAAVQKPTPVPDEDESMSE